MSVGEVAADVSAATQPEGIPSDYRAGFVAACRIDERLAQRYVAHTMIGDPLADQVIAFLSTLPPDQGQAMIRRGIETGAAGLADAPRVLRDFFAASEAVPAWFDAGATLPGCRAFHRHSQMFLGAFVAAVLIEGFSTLISKSFSITGRMVDQGVRRLKQNNRHVVEIFLPGGLERDGDGWALSVRIRLMHARIRQLLNVSEEWDRAAWGTPLSSAHIAYATAVFSGLLLKRVGMLGVTLTEEERQSFMMVWRYAGHLMGVAPDLLFEDEAGALRLCEIGGMCEPPPDFESQILANGLINSAPIVAGITEPRARRKLVRKIYGVSRGLIGDARADALGYPPRGRVGYLGAVRLKNRFDQMLWRMSPALERRSRAAQFQQMLEVSFYGQEGIDYRIAAHLHAEKDRLHTEKGRPHSETGGPS
ncbi:hypothetical protein GCM10011505_44010 [Tistrella bauzanensis]|uniref:ER-bound oxygenase mpaB/mpaB'/Rubber oxygenase catalytic domain-containing protein n=1 Tax=Tistrella bauzanensis TaxID=657419 RepID=A0ABQ1J5E2_9PROT|nr:oxygenase MpaB family protein [Tistrella bauzanensis]GGB58333.1 hypothetical protein GCM10011505_44010 [Tistrella bauzanensis]